MYSPKNFTLAANGIWPGSPRKRLDPYVFNDEIAIAVDVAMATNRPLLVSGPPGSGKSVLAPTLAAIKGWRFLSHTFTSRTRLEDLTGDLDQLRRLNDAQTPREGKPLPPKWAYLEPGILWWAFRPETAALRGGSPEETTRFHGRYRVDFEPPTMPEGKLKGSAVLLFDEIDKAEPDIPNDLLEPLDKKRFTVPHHGEVRPPPGRRHFVVVTTNGERELPPAFLRRCISLTLKEPKVDDLVDIAAQHFPHGKESLHRAIADRVKVMRKDAHRLDIKPPSTSEYLDAIRACRNLGHRPPDQTEPDDAEAIWDVLLHATLVKESCDDELPETDEDAAW